MFPKELEFPNILVKDVMSKPVTINEGGKVGDAIKIMDVNRINKIIVVDDGGKAIGVTEKWKLSRAGEDSVIRDEKGIKKYFITPVPQVNQETELKEIREELKKSPIILAEDEEGKPAGVITQFDLSKAQGIKGQL